MVSLFFFEEASPKRRTERRQIAEQNSAKSQVSVEFDTPSGYNVLNPYGGGQLNGKL